MNFICLTSSVFSSRLYNIDDVILFNPEFGLVLNKSHYLIWNIKQAYIGQPSELKSLGFSGFFDSVWVSTYRQHNQSEPKFNFDFGNVCVRTVSVCIEISNQNDVFNNKISRMDKIILLSLI